MKSVCERTLINRRANLGEWEENTFLNDKFKMNSETLFSLDNFIFKIARL